MTSPTLAAIKADTLTARKARNTDVAVFLGTVVSEAERKGRDQIPPRESTEAEVQSVLKATLDGLNENKKALESGGRTDEPSYAKTVSEITMISAYRPTMLDDEGITSALREYVRTNPAGEAAPASSMKSMKPMMAYLTEKFPGQYDGAVASKIAKGIIAENAG